ncbi:MAG TPA: peptidylprolyl isomerase [Steroidobacteraceae bacterium]
MKVTLIIAAAGLSVLAACTPKSNPSVGTVPNAADKPVAIVNGVPLSRELYDFVAKSVAGKTATQLTEQQRSQLLDSLIRAEVVAQQAQKDGLDKKAETATAMAFQRLQLLDQAASENYLKDRKPTDAELKAEYDFQVAAMPKTQYKARHILVKTKEEADKILEQLKHGAKFEDLAKANSIDNSKNSGGDLGWFNVSNMAKPFGDAVEKLKKGETTAQPVQTEFGWHIIRLDDTRDNVPPPYDSVKDRITQLVQQKKLEAYRDELMKTAKVEKSL